MKLLGEQSSATVTALDRLAGGLLLVASASGASGALGLLEAKNEFAQLSQDLVRGLSDRVRGLGRFDRSERLAAAHAVLVVAAYFEAFAKMPLPFQIRDLNLRASEQVTLVTGELTDSSRLGTLAEVLLRSKVPMPSPQVPYELTLESINAFYAEISSRLMDFIAGLRAWEELGDPERQKLGEMLSDKLLTRATDLYQEFFRRLAASSPEVGFWSTSTNHVATRMMIRDLASGLAGIEEAFRNIAVGREPDDRRAALSHAYRTVLDRPILPTGEMPMGLQMPSLAAGYVNPNFRVAPVNAAARPAEEWWWTEQVPRDDIQSFFVGYLTGPGATSAPMVILGHPGAGKSLLTQVLAARLPPNEFLVVRVILRDVAVESDLQTQIETAIRAATGEAITWPALVRTCGDALPVVLLDGFDELLQVTGASQSDYLERIAKFQQREADQGRPVAVILTSRLAVADRARYPLNATALLLEPFDKLQISRWLKVWNSANSSYFAAHGLTPTPVSAVTANEALSTQPLLLLMLALYDADGNALQSNSTDLRQSELYERLLKRFAEREVMKTNQRFDADDLANRIELELTQLALVAFGMFNRSRQWITDADLDSDLAVLLCADEPGSVLDLRAALTPGQLVVGRFFFVHEAHATQDGRQRKTYEFLHATFGEFLMARLLARELTDMVAIAETARVRGRRTTAPNDEFLYPLLACEPLSARNSTINFLTECLTKELSTSQRETARNMLLQLLRHALHPRRDNQYANYSPLPDSAPARHASYTANLILLATAAADRLTAQQMFPLPTDCIDTWRRHTLLWRSQLSEDGWHSVVDTLSLKRTLSDDQRDLIITLTSRPPSPTQLDPYWIYNEETGAVGRGNSDWQYHDSDSILRQSQFHADSSLDLLTHALEPFTPEFGVAITTFAGYWPDRSLSAAQALIKVWLLSSQRSDPDRLTPAYDDCLEIGTHGFSTGQSIIQDRYLFLVLRQLAADSHRLPKQWLDTALRRVVRLAPDARSWILEEYQTQGVSGLLPRDIAPLRG